MKPGDVVRGAMNETTFRRIVGQMREAAGAKLDGDPVQAVGVLSREHGLNGDEQKGVLAPPDRGRRPFPMGYG